jgi:hypothetical protein
MAISGDRIYAAGFVPQPNPIPVIRQLDLNGRLLWREEFPKLRGYTFADLVAADGGILAVAASNQPSSNETQHAPAVLLQIDRSGRTLKEVPLQGNDGGIVLTRRAAIARWGRNIVVAVNRGTFRQVIPFDRSRLGLPGVCSDRAAVYLTQLDAAELRVTARQVIPGAQITAMGNLGDRLYLAGEALDRCSFRGKAAVYRLTVASKNAEIFWKDSDLSISSVRGLAIANGALAIAVGYQRTLAVEIMKPIHIDMGSKRWGDDGASILEASIIRLSSKDGSIVDRRDLSAGLSVSLSGIELVGGNPIVYGSLGGQPAMTRSDRPQP